MCSDKNRWPARATSTPLSSVGSKQSNDLMIYFLSIVDTRLAENANAGETRSKHDARSSCGFRKRI